MPHVSPDDRPDSTDDDAAPGIFPSWRSLYLTVITYTILIIIGLYVLTRLLDHSGG